MDWKDALAGLQGQLPQGDDVPTHEPQDNKPRKFPTLHVLLDKKQRHGKTATIIEGFDCDDEELKEWARKLKQKIGTGGSARGGEILLQGDWRQKAAELLRAEGFKVKG